MLQIRRNIKVAENSATNLYNNRTHQPDSTGNQDEGIPLFALKFFEVFDWKQTLPGNEVAAQQEANVRVERSLVGQQPVLGENNNQLNNTRAAPNHERGSGEIASEIDVEVIDEADANASSERDIAPNHTNTTRGRRSRRGQTRRHNVAFGNDGWLPPASSNQTHRMDIDRLNNGFTTIANSITALAIQQRVCRCDEINRDIITAMERKATLAAANANESTLEICDQMIADLQAERNRALQFDNHLFASINATDVLNN